MRLALLDPLLDVAAEFHSALIISTCSRAILSSDSAQSNIDNVTPGQIYGESVVSCENIDLNVSIDFLASRIVV